MKSRFSLILLLMLGLGRTNAAPDGPLGIEVGSVNYIGHARDRGRTLSLTLNVTGIDSSRIQAARGVVTLAQDNLGKILRQENDSAFTHDAVGSVSGDRSQMTAKRPLSISLAGPEVEATTLASVEGTVEIILPDLDPNARVVVDDLATHFGVPIDSAALRAAGVVLTVFDKAATEKFTAEGNKIPGGPADYDSGPMFGSREHIPPDFAKIPQLAHMYEFKPNEFGVGIFDPQQRFLGVEFQTATGGTLPYNHHGNYHSNARGGKRFDIFYLPAGIPEGARCVCWVLTDKAKISVPFKLTNIALPRR